MIFFLIHLSNIQQLDHVQDSIKTKKLNCNDKYIDKDTTKIMVRVKIVHDTLRHLRSANFTTCPRWFYPFRAPPSCDSACTTLSTKIVLVSNSRIHRKDIKIAEKLVPSAFFLPPACLSPRMDRKDLFTRSVHTDENVLRKRDLQTWKEVLNRERSVIKRVYRVRRFVKV